MSTGSRGISRCSAKWCMNTSRNCQFSFFRFPKEPEIIRIWAIRSGREDLLNKKNLYNLSYKLCGLHFENKMFLNDLQNRLHKNAVPSIFPLLDGSLPPPAKDPLQEEMEVKVEVKTEVETEGETDYSVVQAKTEIKTEVKTEVETDYSVPEDESQVKIEVKTEPPEDTTPEDTNPYSYNVTLPIQFVNIEENKF